MKNIFRRIPVVMCLLILVLGITACGKPDKSIEIDEAQMIPSIERYVTSMLPTLSVPLVEAQEMQMDEEQYELFHSAAESWEKASEELGDIAGVTSTTITSDEDEVTALVNITGTTGKTAQVEIILNKRMSPTSIVVNVNRSFSENMTNAALNTLLGMGTVFIVLILICLIIYCFKFIGKLEKKEKAAAPAPKSAPVSTAPVVEETDDTELVAVISAAIAAYEESQGSSAEGYVVRSIKRRFG